MESRIDKWGNVVRRLLLISLLFILYSGPAAAIGLNRFLDEEIFGSSTPGEWAGFILIIWLFAVPFGLAYAKWEDDRSTSVFWLGAFLGLLVMFTMVGLPMVRVATALVVAPALSLPFSWLDGSNTTVTFALWSAKICTTLLLVAIPLAALLFQIVRMNKRAEL